MSNYSRVTKLGHISELMCWILSELSRDCDCVVISEHSIVMARASVMIYDDTNKRWIASGISQAVSKVHIYHHTINNTFRVVGRHPHDHEVSLSSIRHCSLCYF